MVSVDLWIGEKSGGAPLFQVFCCQKTVISKKVAESYQIIRQTTDLLGGSPVAESVVRAFIDNVQFNLASSIRGHYIV